MDEFVKELVVLVPESLVEVFSERPANSRSLSSAARAPVGSRESLTEPVRSRAENRRAWNGVDYRPTTISLRTLRPPVVAVCER
jgi:hypothetical protein